jgi:glucose/arabinose dehydrogenase
MVPRSAPRPFTTSYVPCASASHTVRFILADQNHNELANTEATKTLNFSVSQPPTGDLRLESLIPGLNFPVGMSLAPDGRVFFNERLTGNIRIINQQWQLVNTPFCQLSIATSGEQGLLGLALDPDFANNKFVYVYHSVSGPLRNRVVRYTDSSGSCTQETIILDNLPASTNHNGGIIQFGPDGKLYVIIGDSENTANSQNVTSLAGKILRVNPDGSPPSDNPFFSNANANAKRVYSLGHRNSYGFTFHGHTGHLWETENGPSDNDEINRVVSGGNYGWPIVRGIAGNLSFRDPILAYVSVIAPTGIIAIPESSTVYPAAYRNNLLFTAWNDGRIRRVILSGPDLTLLGASSIAYNGGQGGLLSLMLGADGFVYVSNASGIFKVVPQ